MAMSASDIGHLGACLELSSDAGQRGQPVLDEARAIGVPVERSDAAEEPLVVLPQLTPRPALKAARDFGSSAHIDATTCQACGRNTGLAESARTAACSGVSS